MTRDLLEAFAMSAVILISVIAFGAIREVLASGALQAVALPDDVSLGSIPLAGTPAGALILLGLAAAAANAAHDSRVGALRAASLADPGPAA